MFLLDLSEIAIDSRSRGRSGGPPRSLGLSLPEQDRRTRPFRLREGRPLNGARAGSLRTRGASNVITLHRKLPDFYCRKIKRSFPPLTGSSGIASKLFLSRKLHSVLFPPFFLAFILYNLCTFENTSHAIDLKTFATREKHYNLLTDCKQMIRCGGCEGFTEREGLTLRQSSGAGFSSSRPRFNGFVFGMCIPESLRPNRVVPSSPITFFSASREKFYGSEWFNFLRKLDFASEE